VDNELTGRNNAMRYKVIHEEVCIAGFETAQCAGDYLFTIPAEKITEFYIQDTKENAAFSYYTYNYEWGNLVGTPHTALADVLKTLK
jgi:hypothetical protein